MVRVAEPVPVIETGEILAVTVEGKVEVSRLRLTVPVKPFKGVTVTLKETLEGAGSSCSLGETLTLKFELWAESSGAANTNRQRINKRFFTVRSFHKLLLVQRTALMHRQTWRHLCATYPAFRIPALRAVHVTLRAA